MKKEIAKSPYFWILFETPSGLSLNVLCGRSAVFSVEFSLTKEEETKYLTEGIPFIDQLASMVHNNPSQYTNRTSS